MTTPSPSRWIDELGLGRDVSSLQPTPGYCVYIDIGGSTEMKQGKIGRWISLIHNSFKYTQQHTPFDRIRPLKAIGDALMYYIEDSQLTESGVSPFQLFHSLWLIATETERSVFPPVKIGAARCESVYSLTFLKDSQDYYGLDIDLAARLERYAQSGEVAINRRFYDQIVIEHGARASAMIAIRGPEKAELKGFQTPIEIFVAWQQTHRRGDSVA